MSTHHTDTLLNTLLDANARFDLKAKGTTNHLPMALVALARMGASPERLQAYFDMWSREYALPAPAVDTRIARGDWRRHVGDGKAFGALRLCFVDWIGDEGATAVIVAVLKQMPLAPASGAFHAVIRLAYGIEAAHDGEIAAALAALVSGHLPIEIDPASRPRAERIDTAFVQVARAIDKREISGDFITDRLRLVAKHPRFREALLAPPETGQLLDGIAAATIAAYWRAPDFTVLHTVTATHASRLLFAQLPPQLVTRSLPELWVALCAAYASIEVPLDVDKPLPRVDADWDEILRRAVLADDEHVIKMSYTCWREYQRDPSPLYLASAARRVGIID
ncbi:questin oxidase family protein [Burkholderia gladioli]|uniref:questin oxidase family protein n=1 Tax=Burkholderia gladioli TaxID=28095 RepID=UPI003F78E62F